MNGCGVPTPRKSRAFCGGIIVAVMERSAASTGRAAANLAPPVAGFTGVDAVDAIELSEQTRAWKFEFAQLKRGHFTAQGGALDLDGVSAASVVMTQTLLHRGGPPDGMVAVLIAGAGSGPAFINGQCMEAGQCCTIADGQLQHGVSHGYYVDVACAFDLNACRKQLDALYAGDLGMARGVTIANPGQLWVDDMVARVHWILAAAALNPAALGKPEIRASLADRVLAALPRFDQSPAHAGSTARPARAGRRNAVRLATEFIHSRLAQPIRLSELCSHSRLGIRSLEYGFREVTGLTPIAYVRSLRLNVVRRALLRDPKSRGRSISEIAMDTGFWHLSQFAADYRVFFGETPTQTRRRSRLAPAC